MSGEALLVQGPTYASRTPHPDDYTVTPETLKLEFNALREGWSRNVWPRIGRQGHELVLWPRRFHDAPPLTIHLEWDERSRSIIYVSSGGDGSQFKPAERASLARYRWSFNPARYGQTPAAVRLRGWAKVRDFIDRHRTTYAPVVPQPSRRSPAVRRWSVLDEGGPLDGFDGV